MLVCNIFRFRHINFQNHLNPHLGHKMVESPPKVNKVSVSAEFLCSWILVVDKIRDQTGGWWWWGRRGGR